MKIDKKLKPLEITYVFKIAKEEKMILDVTAKKAIARKTIANVIKPESHAALAANANPAKT